VHVSWGQHIPWWTVGRFYRVSPDEKAIREKEVTTGLNPEDLGGRGKLVYQSRLGNCSRSFWGRKKVGLDGSGLKRKVVRPKLE